MADTEPVPAALTHLLRAHAPLAIAVSGGVDSMTLAHAAHRVLPERSVRVYHAVSPAVPQAATDRVEDHGARFGWDLEVLDAGEFADPDYLRNPVNRCYFCKSNLYGRIREKTRHMIASGANLDDLSDYRPGLLAARERNVLHPFVEAGFRKADVRRLARQFMLHDISELPAQPCMASRIETGLAVDPADLRLVEEMERELLHLRDGFHDLGAEDGMLPHPGHLVRLELSGDFGADQQLRDRMVRRASDKCAAAGKSLVEVSPYRKGSAFLHDI